MESFPMIAGGGMPEQEDTENVTYSKTKRQGDASVTISANAKSMQELHDVLKLAGITLPKDDHDHEEPEHAEPDGDEVCPQCGMADCECEPGECDCEPEEPQGIMIKDPSYSNDKNLIMGMLKDKLQQKFGQ